MNARNEDKLTENINDLDSIVSSWQDLASYADIEAESNPTDEIKERAQKINEVYELIYQANMTALEIS